MAQRFLALALLTWTTSACGGGTEHASPRAESVVLITIDTLSATALGCYGGPPGLTPKIDELARESLLFRGARTVAPLTLPAHASMLTGLYPPRHRLRDNSLYALPLSANTLAERCREAGLETAAFVSAAVLDSAFALDQGFDVYDDPPRPTQQNTSHYIERIAEQTLERARSWLAGREDPQRPFFMWVHLYDPHVPYEAPKGYDSRIAQLTDFGELRWSDGDFARAYMGEVAYVDAAVGMFLEALRSNGTLDRAALLLTSDHGESLGLHGEPTHGAFCYDATLRVPMLLRTPDGFGAGEIREDPVSVVDVHPTVLELLGLEPDADADGRSMLLPPSAPRGLYCESYSGYLNYGWSPLAGWCDGRSKYLHSSQPELYELETDPQEQVDLVRANAGQVAGGQRAIASLYQRAPLTLNDASQESGVQLSADLLRDLRSLGYGGTGSELAELPHPLEPSERPSPASRAGELGPLLVANALSAGGDHASAVQLLEAILAENPGHLLALDFLGFAWMQLGEFERALDVLQDRLRRGVRRADTHINVATCREYLNDPAAARADYELALELDPENFQALEALVRICRAAEDEQSAEQYEARLEELRPSTVDTRD